ncbi:MAG TPA: hypothetical protein VFM08_04935 [Nocardioides sp.]|nr:hypothetical protein [Nocardioides sp.]
MALTELAPQPPTFGALAWSVAWPVVLRSTQFHKLAREAAVVR